MALRQGDLLLAGIVAHRRGEVGTEEEDEIRKIAHSHPDRRTRDRLHRPDEEEGLSRTQGHPLELRRDAEARRYEVHHGDDDAVPATVPEAVIVGAEA